MQKDITENSQDNEAKTTETDQKCIEKIDIENDLQETFGIVDDFTNEV